MLLGMKNILTQNKVIYVKGLHTFLHCERDNIVKINLTQNKVACNEKGHV